MSSRAVRFSMILMMAIMAPLTVAGCVMPEDEAGTGDEVASDLVAGEQVAGDEAASREAPDEVAQLASIEIRNVTCRSGWPGTRGCSWLFTSSTSIVPGSIIVQINGHNGAVGYTAAQVGTNKVSFTATVHEGNAFDPGSNTTSFTVAWLRN